MQTNDELWEDMQDLIDSDQVPANACEILRDAGSQIARLSNALLRLYQHAVAVRSGQEGEPVAVLATQTLLYDLGVFSNEEDEDEE